jgi:hypothetical protein
MPRTPATGGWPPSKELASFAFNNGFDSLAIIFEMARKDTARILQASDEHLSRSRISMHRRMA